MSTIPWNGRILDCGIKNATLCLIQWIQPQAQQLVFKKEFNTMENKLANTCKTMQTHTLQYAGFTESRTFHMFVWSVCVCCCVGMIFMNLGRDKAKNSLTKSAMSLCRTIVQYKQAASCMWPLDLTCAWSYLGALGSEWICSLSSLVSSLWSLLILWSGLSVELPCEIVSVYSHLLTRLTFVDGTRMLYFDLSACVDFT